MVAISALLAVAAAPLLASAAPSQCYNWKNVKVGGGGGFIPGIVFNPTEKGLAYARTDIGGAYRLNADDTWTPLNDNIGSPNWNRWGVDAIATDPVDTNRVYLAVGMYTISWDPNNGAIMRSTDKGNTWSETVLPFKVGGNMPGRGIGERLTIDPHSNNILYFGARSGNGLWKSTDYGVTWAKVSSFTNVGTFKPNATDPNEYMQDPIGLAWITFDENSGGSKTVATPRIFVGVADLGNSIFVSNNAGSTWTALAGQPTGYIPHKGVFSAAENVLYITYSNGGGPYDGTLGSVWKYNLTSSAWTNITPPSPSDSTYYGFGGFAIDKQKPGTIMVAALNSWWPDGIIWRSTNSGATWTSIWEWAGYPTRNKYYKIDASAAPWVYDPTATDPKDVGWMMEALVIDPFDSNHWLYGTGATILGSRDLLKWDSSPRNVTLKIMADGIEETAIQDLLSPPQGPGILLSGMYDAGGFLHRNLDVPQTHTDQFHIYYTGTTDIDYAGNKPLNLVRVGTQLQELSSSNDGGVSWNKIYAANNAQHGTVALSADGDIIIWSPNNGQPIRSQYTNAFTTISALPANAAIAADRRNNNLFYGASTNQFYVSTNGALAWSATATLTGATKAYKIVPNPTASGDVWVSTDNGLFRSTDSGSSFTKIGGVTVGGHFDLGAPKTTGAYWSIAGFFTVDGVAGIYRSDDAGVNWVRINDNYGFGAADANKIAVDYKVYGRIFVGTNGRGIFYGNPSCSSPPPTSSTTSARTSSSTTAVTTTRTTTPVTTSSTTAVRTSTTTSSTTAVRTSTTTPVVTTTRTTTASTTVATTARTTTTSAGGALQNQWGQCGGIGWTGPTACVSPYTCQVGNPYYSQCL
ncbi:hypothetical protein EYR41_007659 [Orbilia oligospora]|uniref:Uncharacterized protein n=1 Tax=Orbilia oligospora TaxID=2813651 RepID=A0A7C8U7Q8_ORBOL|nr:hypothetical protein TWF751_008278 [Orbilia oligospora]TGJ68618.1 hypothetical protein EYR41_007659 [Orbilia oligospora]